MPSSSDRILQYSSAQDVLDWLDDTNKWVQARTTDKQDGKMDPRCYYRLKARSFREFPWNMILEQSDRKAHLMTCFNIIVQLMRHTQQSALVMFDNVLHSILVAVKQMECVRESDFRRLALFASFSSDFVLATMTLMKNGDDDGWLGAFIKSKSYMQDGAPALPFFLINMLMSSLDALCVRADGTGAYKRQSIRREKLVELLHVPRERIFFPARTRVFARALWMYFIELENDIQKRETPNEALAQILDELVSGVLTRLLEGENRPMSETIVAEAHTILEVLAGVPSARKSLALHFVYFALASGDASLNTILRDHTEQAIASRRFELATNYILFLASYCARESAFLNADLLKAQFEWLIKQLRVIVSITEAPEHLLITRYAILQSIMYLATLLHDRAAKGVDVVSIVKPLLTNVNFACICPSVVERFKPLAEKLPKSNPESVHSTADVQKAISWFPFDPTPMANLWDIVVNSRYCYIL